MILVVLLLAVLLTSIVWYFIYTHRIKNLEDQKAALENELHNLNVHIEYKINQEALEKTQHLKDQITSLKEESLKAEKESYFSGRNEAIEEFRNDFKIQIQPYKRTFKQKRDGILAIGEVEKIEIGYQYQLFIKGSPSLSPAIIILETYDLKHFKLNEEAIQDLVNATIGAKLQTAGKVIEIVSKVISRK
ncbi:hypothetical protein FLAN108750_08940 [Flavobacterium antarcticum]|uniref:hypothetical protein n=1 Tax=Flavobacterium antarcticum TaxID=271155 RepID=UPI0003B41AF9|nr:hypothetical protein [Flavobacterium antarcticum]